MRSSRRPWSRCSITCVRMQVRASAGHGVHGGLGICTAPPAPSPCAPKRHGAPRKLSPAHKSGCRPQRPSAHSAASKQPPPGNPPPAIAAAAAAPAPRRRSCCRGRRRPAAPAGAARPRPGTCAPAQNQSASTCLRRNMAQRHQPPGSPEHVHSHSQPSGRCNTAQRPVPLGVHGRPPTSLPAPAGAPHAPALHPHPPSVPPAVGGNMAKLAGLTSRCT